MTLQRISESVFVGLCYKIGTSQQVAIRRDIVDIRELMEHKVEKTEKNGMHMMLSGSRREGFRLETSDMDFMFWPNHYPVLWDFSQAQFYNTERDTLILCDSTESPPGFTLLWLPLERADCNLLSPCVRLNGALYISSGKHIDNCSAVLPGSTVHGPCGSGSQVGLIEYDFAFCFASDFWPPSASSWIDRCHTWPLPCIVDDIIKSDCHFVAIGHKHGKHVNNEWRISFSQAEQKLVYSMNHTQFLTYGLLKLFVKDFNNGLSGEEQLLCSYHMKTTIFWVIQQKTIDWCPQNLLAAFWICFKLLLKWVYEGVCPNFFIPENNMFLNKVHGNAQRNLFTRLYGLYEKGISFLLESPSISSYLMGVICSPRLFICTDDRSMISDAIIDACLLLEMTISDVLSIGNLHNCMKYLHTVEQLIHSYLTQYQIIMFQKLTVTILQTSALTLHETCTNSSGVDKHMYIADKLSCYMLKLAAKFGFVSDLLFVAMYYYKTLRYRAALSVIKTTKVKLKHARIMYGEHEDPERYTEVVGGQSWSRKIRQAVPDFISLQSNICFINELTLEQSALQSSLDGLSIPPFILLHMLEFLCCRHVDPMRAHGALYDLQDLVHHDQGVLVNVTFRDISWEILGICQELAGDYQSALFSYQQSLGQLPMNNIQSSTRHRILNLPVT